MLGFIILLIGVSVSASQSEKKEQIPIHNCIDSFDEPLTTEQIYAIQKQAEIEEWSFTVGETSASKRSLDELCGLVEPDNWWEGADFDPILPLQTPPSSFDWREKVSGGLPPIRDQGNCGSCWAFATIGPIECNIKINDKVSVDLSEQWLVSCNQEPNKWGCGGGWWAHEYFKENGKEDPCGDSGGVLENNFPYTAQDDDCDCPYPHAYFIERCAYVGNDHEVPSVNALKQAIQQYGPVTVGVCVSIYFKLYTGGVFDYESLCWPGTVNHGVVLVGWHDSLGEEGVWILRNSWGEDWGENGYMYIEYGCSLVGYGARYVDYGDRLTVFCANETKSQDPSSTKFLHGIPNARVTVRSYDGTIEESDWTNDNGLCCFYNLPENKEYYVRATHTKWNQKEVDWISDNYVLIIMTTNNSRIRFAHLQFLDRFPLLKLFLKILG